MLTVALAPLVSELWAGNLFMPPREANSEYFSITSELARYSDIALTAESLAALRSWLEELPTFDCGLAEPLASARR